MTHGPFLREIGFSRTDHAAADTRRWLYLTVLLAILKVIGIILLVLLGLLVCVCAALLFIPVRYSAQFVADGSVSFGFTASWCLRIVKLQKRMSEQDIHLSLFGWKIGKNKKRNKRKKEKNTDQGRPGSPDASEEPAEASEDSGARADQNEDQKYEEQKKTGKTAKPGKKSFFKKKSFSFDGISSIITFIRDGDNKKGMQKIKKELLFLFRYLKPSYVRGHLYFGTGDPCTTGWALGLISLLPAAYTEGIDIVPDFLQKKLDAEIYAKGKVHFFYFLRMLVRGYMDADIKTLISKVLNFE